MDPVIRVHQATFPKEIPTSPIQVPNISKISGSDQVHRFAIARQSNESTYDVALGCGGTTRLTFAMFVSK